MLKKKGRSEWILQSYSRRLLWDSTWRSCVLRARSVCKSTIYSTKHKVQTQIFGQIKVLYLLETSNSFKKKIQQMAFSWFIWRFSTTTGLQLPSSCSHAKYVQESKWSRHMFYLLWFRALGYSTTPHGKATVVFYVSPFWLFKWSR